MIRNKLVLAAVPLALLAATAAPAGAATPNPDPGTPACAGRLVATFNHLSAEESPSDNPSSSSGPGVTLRQDTSAVIAEVRSLFCTG